MKIIVDAMGGDNAPQAPVMGAIQASKEYGVDIILVGRGEEAGVLVVPQRLLGGAAQPGKGAGGHPAFGPLHKKDHSLEKNT